MKLLVERLKYGPIKHLSVNKSLARLRASISQLKPYHPQEVWLNLSIHFSACLVKGWKNWFCKWR